VSDLGLARIIEVVLTVGLVISAALMLLGLATGSAPTLRAGILLLMLTPVARVAVVTLALLRQRDYVFGLVSLGILGVLCFSMFVGARLQ